MDEAEKQKRRQALASALQTKGVNLPCPRCYHKQFNLIGESSIQIQENPAALVLGGEVVPTAIVACVNCGYIMLHASLILGVQLPTEGGSSGK